jgi:hypothetical protein
VTPTQRLPPLKRFIAVRVMPALLLLVSAFFVYVGVQNRRLARESVNWPSVDGEIVSAQVVEELNRSRTGPSTRTYRPTIRYRYRVNGVEFEGDRVSLGEYATGDRADAEQVVGAYPAGRPVRVHYRLDAPATAVLEPGASGLPSFYAALGGVFFVAGLVLAWAAPKLIAPAGV